uniref:Gelsolin-like domain-containing protein n=1 Tax=Ascaris lumbricoides TaxID=6252 RepID=A0A9J2PC02_ASCLU
MHKAVDAEFKNAGKQRGLEIWRVMNFGLTKLPKEQHGSFYVGDSYIVLNTKSAASWDVHFWLGKETTLDEQGTAAYKAVELDDALGGAPVQYREVQEHESPLFMSYFKSGIRYMKGGAESAFRHIPEDNYENWKPCLFHCKGKRNVRCTEVECKRSSLNVGDVFILDCGLDVYVWMPPESGRLERIKGMEQARSIRDIQRNGKARLHCIDTDWNTNEEFWGKLGGIGNLTDLKSAEAGGADDQFWRARVEKIILWRVSDETGKIELSKVSEGNFRRSQLQSKDAFILDAGTGGLFVWIGNSCSRNERINSMKFAREFIKQQGKPEWTGVVRVMDGSEPEIFTQWASAWEGGMTKKKVPSKLFQCSDESGKLQIEEIARFTQQVLQVWIFYFLYPDHWLIKDLDGDDVMILDNFDAVYVWIGAKSNANEKKNAADTARKYLETDSIPRPPSAIIKTVHQGKETTEFKRLFPAWDDNLFKRVTVPEISETMVYGCAERCRFTALSFAL